VDDIKFSHSGPCGVSRALPGGERVTREPKFCSMIKTNIGKYLYASRAQKAKSVIYDFLVLVARRVAN